MVGDDGSVRFDRHVYWLWSMAAGKDAFGQLTFDLCTIAVHLTRRTAPAIRGALKVSRSQVQDLKLKITNSRSQTQGVIKYPCTHDLRRRRGQTTTAPRGGGRRQAAAVTPPTRRDLFTIALFKHPPARGAPPARPREENFRPKIR
ncbi:hypothetical protein EVAR_11265_1 [Eumeta japonica]|uniref:Uncharacterized protein n=1 Tax=Eumeta variegata TaxID=151549 RepID=A0A4C1ULI2_EUMVA|nr:hypothetical protein EVAR_11265_1 [Eumeta japonica]